MTSELKRRANIAARNSGCGRATAVTITCDIYGEHRDIVVNRVSFGWRKRSNGQYVPKAYVRKGWSSVFYQKAVCVVQVVI